MTNFNDRNKLPRSPADRYRQQLSVNTFTSVASPTPSRVSDISWLKNSFPAFPAFLIHLIPVLRLRAFAPLR